MKNLTKFLLDFCIDLILQGSLVLYYFMNNNCFIIENIIKFIPIFLSLVIILQIVAFVMMCAIRFAIENNDFETLNSNKDECKKVLLKIDLKKSKLRCVYDKVTDISLSILLVLTGHPFCFIMFLINKIIFKLSKRLVELTLKEMEN